MVAVGGATRSAPVSHCTCWGPHSFYTLAISYPASPLALSPIYAKFNNLVTFGALGIVFNSGSDCLAVQHPPRTAC